MADAAVFDESKRRADDYDGVQAEAANFNSGVAQQTAEMDEESKRRLIAMRGAGVGLIQTLDSYAGSAGDSAAMRSVQAAAQRFADQYADYNRIAGGLNADVLLDRNGDFHVRLGRKEDGFPVKFDLGQMEASLRKSGYLESPQPAQRAPEMIGKDGNPLTFDGMLDWGKGRSAADRRAAARHYGWGETFFGGDEAALNEWIGGETVRGNVQTDPWAEYGAAQTQGSRARARGWAKHALQSGVISPEEYDDVMKEIESESWGLQSSGGSSRGGAPKGGNGGLGAEDGGESASTGTFDNSSGAPSPSGGKGNESAAASNPFAGANGSGAAAGDSGTTPDEQKSMEQLRVEAADAGNYEVDEMEWDSKKGKFVPKPLKTPWNVKGAESAVTHHVRHPDNKTISFSLPSSNDTTTERGVDTVDVRGGVHTAREILNRMGIEPDHGDSYVLTNEQYAQVLEVIRSGKMPKRPGEPQGSQSDSDDTASQESSKHFADDSGSVIDSEGGSVQNGETASQASPSSVSSDFNGSEAPAPSAQSATAVDEEDIRRRGRMAQKNGFKFRWIDGEWYAWHDGLNDIGAWVAADGHAVREKDGGFADVDSDELYIRGKGESIITATGERFNTNGAGSATGWEETQLQGPKQKVPPAIFKLLRDMNNSDFRGNPDNPNSNTSGRKSRTESEGNAGSGTYKNGYESDSTGMSDLAGGGKGLKQTKGKEREFKMGERTNADGETTVRQESRIDVHESGSNGLSGDKTKQRKEAYETRKAAIAVAAAANKLTNASTTEDFDDIFEALDKLSDEQKEVFRAKLSEEAKRRLDIELKSRGIAEKKEMDKNLLANEEAMKAAEKQLKAAKKNKSSK